MQTLCTSVGFPGVWVVQGSCSWNLSVEPVCRPSPLQRLLVCSVRCAAMLRGHEWKCLIRPSGNYVLPALKVLWDVKYSTSLWVSFFRQPIYVLSPSNSSVSECCATPYSLLGLTFVVSYLALGLLNLCKFYLGGYAAVQNENVMHRWDISTINVAPIHHFVPNYLSTANTEQLPTCGDKRISLKKTLNSYVSSVRLKLTTEQGEFQGEFFIIFLGWCCQPLDGGKPGSD